MESIIPNAFPAPASGIIENYTEEKCQTSVFFDKIERRESCNDAK
jgi:hypothetical protein